MSEPSGVGTAVRTGDAAVDEALERLEALSQSGLEEQVRVLAEVHEALQQRLSSSQH